MLHFNPNTWYPIATLKHASKQCRPHQNIIIGKYREIDPNCAILPDMSPLAPQLSIVMDANGKWCCAEPTGSMVVHFPDTEAIGRYGTHWMFLCPPQDLFGNPPAQPVDDNPSNIVPLFPQKDCPKA